MGENSKKSRRTIREEHVEQDFMRFMFHYKYGKCDAFETTAAFFDSHQRSEGLSLKFGK